MKKIFILVAIIMYCFMAVGFCADGFYVIPVKGKSSYAVGDTGPAGGKVFYITPGSDGKHGLEAAPSDQSGDAEWGCNGTMITSADRLGVGTGAHNTLDIMEDCSASDIAAKVAGSYELNGFNDWFLPSRDELSLLYQNRGVVGGFADDSFWSSSQINSLYAFAQDFSNGDQLARFLTNTFRVRAVRAF